MLNYQYNIYSMYNHRPHSRHHSCLTRPSHTDDCSLSKVSSKKKFLTVTSNPNYQPPPSRNLNQSTVSLPISYGERRMRNQPLYQSQVRNPSLINPISISRSASMPRFDSPSSCQKVIVRETVRAIPVNFLYVHPKSINIEPRPVPVADYRHSLPTKKEIVLGNSNRTFNNEANKGKSMQYLNQKPRNSLVSNPSLAGYPAPRSSIMQIPSRRKMGNNQNQENIYRIQQKKPINDVQLKTVPPHNGENAGEEYQETPVLNNLQYLECQINLASCVPAKSSHRQQKSSQAQNFNSLEVIKGDTYKNLRENLEIGSFCCQEETAKFESDIKINTRQALQPKRNLMFV